MEADVRKWRQSCLQCVKSAKGDVIPRPLGTQLIPEFPGEIIMLDYIEIGPSDEGFSYVLMAVGKYTKLCEFVPATAATAIHASRVLLARVGQPLRAA